jgi:outer membrane protein OmpA-like peptidoglycan-associated protein
LIFINHPYPYQEYILLKRSRHLFLKYRGGQAMWTRKIMGFLIVFVWIMSLPVAPFVKAQSAVHYLSDQELTSDKLIEILRPATAMRGVNLKPQCEKYRGATRGIQPITEAAAIRVLFAFNSATLSPEAAGNLNKVAEALKSSDLASYCFRIEGHADNIGSDSYNQLLSDRRATSVVQYLANRLGVESARLLAVGYGKSRPIDNNATEEGRQKNRRVQIVNLGTGTSTTSEGGSTQRPAP